MAQADKRSPEPQARPAALDHGDQVLPARDRFERVTVTGVADADDISAAIVPAGTWRVAACLFDS